MTEATDLASLLPAPIVRRLAAILAAVAQGREWNRGARIMLSVNPDGIVTAIEPTPRYELTREELDAEGVDPVR